MISKAETSDISTIESTDDEKNKQSPNESCEAMHSGETICHDSQKMRNRILSANNETSRLSDHETSDLFSQRKLYSQVCCENVNIASSTVNKHAVTNDLECVPCYSSATSSKLSESEVCKSTVNDCPLKNMNSAVNCETNVTQSFDHPDCYFVSDVLPFVRFIFSDEFTNETSLSWNHEVSHDHAISLYENERADCLCYKPCEVPSSPSVVDATLERTGADDGEIFSSGDELDKLESDTDSQDTVIEGEAYKRIRSVAIKEKILHANEVLFGGSVKATFFEAESYGMLTSNVKVIKHHMYSEKNQNQVTFGETVEKSSDKCDQPTNVPDLPLFSDSEESDNSLVTISSLEKHLHSFEKNGQSIFYPVLPLSSNDKKNVNQNSNVQESSLSSSYKTCLAETLCSSESSDNGSDGEEVILSDTSTSSDEATYIAPSSGFRYYSHPLSYRLHTIIEESCEESEKSSRGATPTSRASSDFEYFDKIRSSSSRSPRKMQRKSPIDSSSQNSNPDSKNGKVSAVYAVLASSRLEKYFKSGLLKGEQISYPEDDLTDESGGISSEDDDENIIKRKERTNGKTARQSHHGKTSSEKQSHMHKLATSACEKSKEDLKHVSSTSEASTAMHSYNLLAVDNRFSSQHSLSDKQSCDNCDQSFAKIHKAEQTEAKQSKNLDVENVSDDEAKYIMSHLMQHITNNNDVKPEANSEIKDMSPMLKILESEIARLMLTVSPASLSAGEPSSSCSSTIGSNNSDYGSDTLESGDESTSEEDLNGDIPSENSVLLEITPPMNSITAGASVNIDLSVIDNTQTSGSPLNSDSIVSEETLYICKQLMASLKKIADATEGTSASDEFCSADSEDHTAKQYITDQIVSLMQTVNASRNNSPLLQRLNSNNSPTSHLDSDISQDRSDSDSPQPNDEKRGRSKSKTPSESGSETTISASISIPSYDDSDRTPTESEISHEMDELYALLENNGTAQDMIASAKFSYDLESRGLDEGVSLRNTDSPLSEDDSNFIFSDSCDSNITTVGSESSLLCGAASKLESLLPISIEERIARYKDAFLNKCPDHKDNDHKGSETRINVILPQPAISELKKFDEMKIVDNSIESQSFSSAILNTESGEECSSFGDSFDSIVSSCSSYLGKSEDTNYNVTSVKIISHNTYPPSSAIHKILSNKIDSTYMEKKLGYKIVNVLDASEDQSINDNKANEENIQSPNSNEDDVSEETQSIIAPLPKVMNPKEKASSENDLLVANYRAKSKNSKVFGTKSVGNISELENINNKNTFRDTGYYSFKSSEESFLSLDDSTASQTSTASLTQYRSLTSTETIPEEEESCSKVATPSKMSLSSSNIPDAVCDTSGAKSSTLPLSLRSKLSATPGGNHRTRSSFFSTSGVLRKLTMLRDESGNSLRSSPHGRLRMRNRSLSGGSEDGKQRKTSVPQIAVSECSEQSQVGRLSAASSEKDSSGVQEDDLDQVFAYHNRSISQSLSSFGGRSESVTSVYSAAGGGRYGTVTVTGEVLFGLCYNYKTATFEINIKECRNLAPVDNKRNRSDPYIKVYLLPDRTKSGKRKTKVKKRTLSPMFDELLKFQVTISELETRTLWLSVWHSDRFGRNDFLGEVMLPLGYDTFENPGLKWYPLQERLETLDAPVSYKGDLILALKYVPPDVTTRKHPKKPGDLTKGALHVLVREARNLMATRSNGTSDPFCKSYLLPDKSKSGKQKTPVFKKSCNPKWNHTFVYEDVTVDDLKDRCLELTIWDYDKITSNDFLGGVRLCLGTGKFQGREVDWMDSVGEEISLWYTMLDRPNTWVDGSLLLRPSMQSRRVV